ncbi:MAG: DNA-formamidopyrimidine glycosylase, partial [bacterium]|nr:DNA-formamidopyrimidine glycosylase [bacterium]
MPELPEVETIVRDLRKNILGLSIRDIWYDWKGQFNLPKDPERFKKLVVGRRIVGVRRRAKNILIDLSGGYLLLIHQKMTGHLLIGRWQIKNNRPLALIEGPLKEKVNNYIHLIFYLSGGKQLALSDLRKFAKVMAGRREDIGRMPDLAELGPEPLNKYFDISKFRDLIKKEKRPVKQVLMDQTVIAGIGNIYSDEILWQAKVFPLKSSAALSLFELKNIFKAVKEILNKAVKTRGTSISDFRDTAGREGGYTGKRKVYRREGEPCPRCQTLIKR